MDFGRAVSFKRSFTGLRLGENGAGDEVEDEGAHPASLLARFGGDGLQRCSVGKAGRTAEGESGELMGEVLSDEVLAFFHQLTELPEAAETPHARPFISGIDERAVGEFGTSAGLGFAQGAVVFSPATDDVEAL